MAAQDGYIIEELPISRITDTGVGIILVSQVDSKTGEAKCPKGKANLTLNQ